MTLKPARTLLIALFVVGVALTPATASAAQRTKNPTVSVVAPLNLGIGDTLTITGRNFRAGRNRNTVVFKRDGQRAVFVTAAEATTTRIRLKVPDKLAAYLSRRSDGSARPTRFRLRILSARFGRAFTSTRLSPVVSAATTGSATPSTGVTIRNENGRQQTVAVDTDPDCDADGLRNSADADDDNDFLSDVLEVSLKLNTCNSDTDADGMQDGWEYQSAIDLNTPGCNNPAYPTPCSPATPYPWKVPYPNPLDGRDGSIDFDGDWIDNFREHQAWAQHTGHDLSIAGMWYSGGLKASQDPVADACVGLPKPAPRAPFTSAYVALFETDNNGLGNGCLHDGERDEDNDMLSNTSELSGPLSGVPFWAGNFTTENQFGRVTYSGTNWLDGDTDGDGVYDGMDDQDHDDYWNAEEQIRGTWSVTKSNVATGATTGLWTNPFNPCLPNDESRTCPDSGVIGMAPWAPLPLNDGTYPSPRWPLAPGGAPSHPIALPY